MHVKKNIFHKIKKWALKYLKWDLMIKLEKKSEEEVKVKIF